MRKNELVQVATTLIFNNQIDNREKYLAQIIVSGLDDDFNPEQSTNEELDDYLRDQALHFWFFPKMDRDKVINRLTNQIRKTWEVQDSDDKMKLCMLKAVLAYQVQPNESLKNFLLKEDQSLTTIAGFKLEKVNALLLAHHYQPLPIREEVIN